MKEHSPTNNRPDGSVYLESDEEAYMLTPAELETSKGSDERKPFMARPALSKSIMPLEIKLHPSTEAFKVNEKGELILPDSATSIQTRGQLFEYCISIFGRQSRQHLFAVHVFRNMVTLLAMDRVNVTAAVPFDYVKEPLKLLTFFYRLALSDSSALGFDPITTLASDKEKAILYDFLPVVDPSKKKPAALSRIHCRLVPNEVAHHLSEYEDSRQLIYITLHAVHGEFYFSPLSLFSYLLIFSPLSSLDNVGYSSQ